MIRGWLMCVCTVGFVLLPSSIITNCILLYCPDRSGNATHEAINATLHTLLAATTRLVAPTPPKPILPVQTGVQAQQEEQSSGMTIFFSLLVIGEW